MARPGLFAVHRLVWIALAAWVGTTMAAPGATAGGSQRPPLGLPEPGHREGPPPCVSSRGVPWIARGGGPEDPGTGGKSGNVLPAPSVVAIGVLDLPPEGKPGTRGVRSSVVLVVSGRGAAEIANENEIENEPAARVDGELLERCLPPVGSLPEPNPNGDPDPSTAGTDAVVESLALLCDALVVRGTGGGDGDGDGSRLPEGWEDLLRRGDERRRSAGMEGCRLWTVAAGGGPASPRPIFARPGGDDPSPPAASTWSALFSGAGGDAGELAALFEGTAEGVLRSHPARNAGAPVRLPLVSVVHREPATGAREAAMEGDPDRSPRAEPPADDGPVVGDVLAESRRRLEALETRMEESVLGQSPNPMPLLEFGSLVQGVLETAERRLAEETSLPEGLRRGLVNKIAGEVQRLYKDQLQALRNYYGRRYEAVLDGDAGDGEATDRRWAAAARHATEAFSAAAANAVPAVYREGPSPVSFDHTGALEGLVRDMIDSTERRRDERDVATLLVADDDDEAGDAAAPGRRLRLPEVPKWVERLAARAFVFGVNYVQGWLAWQGIRRAAIERDRNQPKFPLF